MTWVTINLKMGEGRSILGTNITSTLPQMTDETTLKKGGKEVLKMKMIKCETIATNWHCTCVEVMISAGK